MKRFVYILLFIFISLASCSEVTKEKDSLTSITQIDMSIQTDGYFEASENITRQETTEINIQTTQTTESEEERRETLIKALAALPMNQPAVAYEDIDCQLITADDPSPDSFIVSVTAVCTSAYGFNTDGSKRLITNKLCFPRLVCESRCGGVANISYELERIYSKYDGIILAIQKGFYSGQRVWNFSYSYSIYKNIAAIIIHISVGYPGEVPVVSSYPFYLDINSDEALDYTEYLSRFGYVPEELTEAVTAQVRKDGIEYDDPFMEKIEYMVYHGDKRFTIVLRAGTVSDSPVVLELEVNNTFLGDLKRTYIKALSFNSWTSCLYGPKLDVFYHVTHDIMDAEAVVTPYSPDYNDTYWYCNPPTPLEYENRHYYKVNEPSIYNYNSLASYISDIFPSAKVAEIMRRNRQTAQKDIYDYKSFTEIDGMLWYMVDITRDGDISYGKASYYLKELTDKQAVMTAKVEYHEEIFDSEGSYLYTKYDFHYFDIVFEQIDGKWLITSFPAIW
ncbi:MAG: hypothetical protein AB9835_13465 [Eubacteriales bacterium]